MYKRKGDLGKALLAVVVGEVCFDFFSFLFFFSLLFSFKRDFAFIKKKKKGNNLLYTSKRKEEEEEVTPGRGNLSPPPRS